MKIGDVSKPITTWLSLSDSKHNSCIWGELMFSISYLPTAERLTVVVVKARNLKLVDESKDNQLQNVFAKVCKHFILVNFYLLFLRPPTQVYLLKNGKKVSKKKTSVKRSDRSPIFNESMIFSVPPYMLNSIQVRLTIVNTMDLSPDSSRSTCLPIGHVIVGGNTTGKGLRHWNQMLSSLRKPIAMWHVLRQTVAKVPKNSLS